MPASTAFGLQAVLGSVYSGTGNVLFTPDSASLISPIGARCSVFPLATTAAAAVAEPSPVNEDEGQQPSAEASTSKAAATAATRRQQEHAASTTFDAMSATTRTFSFELRRPIARMALSPPLGPRSNVHLLLAADRDGRSILISFHANRSSASATGGNGGGLTTSRESVLAHINFKAPLRDANFSPDARYLAVTHNNQIQVWKVPGFNHDDQDQDMALDGSLKGKGKAKSIGIIAPSFTPFELHRIYTGHFDDVLSITWTRDSK